MFGCKAGIHFEEKTVGVRDDLIEHESYIGDLRRTVKSVSKLPSVTVAGGKLGNALDQYLLAQPHAVKLITQLLHASSLRMTEVCTGHGRTRARSANLKELP